VRINPIAFAAEAALWVTGAALIASAAGATWPMPSVDLSSLLAGPSAGPSVSAAPTASATPTILTAAQKLQAFFARPDLEFEAKGSATMKIQANGVTANGASTTTVDYKAGDTSRSTKLTLNGKTSPSDRINLGQTHYARDNGGPWTSRPRNDNDTRTVTILFTNREFADKGMETKGGRQVHRIDVSDSAAFNADYNSAQGTANAAMSLVFWTDDGGVPVAYQLSGTFGVVVSGVSESFTIDEQWSFVKTSGITIKAPV
jgi:hypothetical protein